MRFVAAFVLCLAGGIAAAGAQVVQNPTATRSAEPQVPIEQAATPATQVTAKAGEQSTAGPATADVSPAQATKPAQQPDAQQADQPAKADAQFAPTERTDSMPPNEPAAAPAAQPAAASVEQTNANPAEQTAAPSSQPPATEPVQHAILHPVGQPADNLVEGAPAQPKKQAEACPGHPDAIGTSRVITISPTDYREIGAIQYRRTLPLKDHEVVLTFDDGPIPPYTNSILDTLAANCVKATYFLVGEMAHARPYLVRRIYNEGHAIGTHTQHHPLAIQRMSMARVEYEVDSGIASVDYALGDAKAISPFFRIPGLGRTNAIEHFLESKGLITWSADVDTNDWWRGTTPAQLVERTMRRLNARGRGILLMHDIHPATALALPTLLKELKAAGYHVVQVVAAGERPKSLPQVTASAVEKEAWPSTLHAQAEKSGPAMSSLHRRVKATIASTSRHHHRHARIAKRAKPETIDYIATARKGKNAAAY
jgi:peptidoglycan/xylan/chitin deacetylase (PgdA/CDA1 family)